MKNLSNKVILVTGASKGIGAEVAKQLAEAKASVIVNYAGSKADADSVVETIKSRRQCHCHTSGCKQAGRCKIAFRSIYCTLW
jgi:Dehydrogenases with different specificities (related to short-chain alcohol dehydrogenases)